MRIIKVLGLVLCAAVLASCGKKAPPVYLGPEITHIYVEKANRRMMLLHGNEVIKMYDIDLGFVPEGHKQFEGDGRTPEGTYYIDRRNPNSAFHLSLGVSYPNPIDHAYAKQVGRSAGGDIFLHGRAGRDQGRKDWTAGCIAVSDKEIEEIYFMVRTGTPITIVP